ncbi:plant disease resistance response protein, partial [Tanacetum coccineum]
LDSLSCPICECGIESVGHLFFQCQVVRQVVRKISFWWNVNYVDFNSYEEWLNWLTSLRLTAKYKELLEGVFYVLWWLIWSFRNKTVFEAKPPSKAVIFDNVVPARTITVIDDLLNVDPHLSSQSLRNAQGVYITISSADGSRKMMTFTAMMEDGEYGDSINFFGVYHIGSAMSRLSITGGTGKYLHACGFAEVRSLIPAGQIVADGVESLLRLTV